MRYELIASRDDQLTAVEQVLSNRGIKLQDIHRFKYPTDSEILDPRLLEHMQDGAKMLISHIAQDHEIFFQIDSDTDGYTSSAILINYLNELFPHFAQTKISYRLHEGKQHGIILNTIPKEAKLVVALDSSSNQYEEHAALASMGIDVLVIDHHEAPRYSEHACVINNQLCNYPTKSLSGAGVVWKFCCYLDSLLGTNHASQFIDLATVGINNIVLIYLFALTKRVNFY